MEMFKDVYMWNLGHRAELKHVHKISFIMEIFRDVYMWNFGIWDVLHITC